MSSYPGIFYDGLSARKHEVQVSFDTKSLTFSGSTVDSVVVWAFTGLRAVRKIKSGQTVELNTSAAPDARLIVANPVFGSAVLARAPHLRHRRGYSSRWWEHPWTVAAMVLAFIVTVVMTVPLLAAPLARAVPDSWRDTIGASIERMVSTLGTACTNTTGSVALIKLVSNLESSREGEILASSVKVINGPLTNAFALPGGRIVVFGKLIDVMETPNELAGVLAHEMGHIAERHPTEASIRSTGFSLFLTMLVGGSSTLTEFLASLGIQAVESSYSRDDERTADRIALELLAAAGADPGKLADTFVRLQKVQEKEGSLFLGNLGNILSTHPPYDERIATARAHSQVSTRPLLTDAEWRALKNICDQPEPSEPEVTASTAGNNLT